MSNNNTEPPWNYEGEIAFLPGGDPLWRHTPLPLSAQFGVLGVPLEIATNASRIIELAQEVFGHWGCSDPEEPAEPLRLRALVHTTPSNPLPSIVQPIIRAQEGYFFVTAGQSLGFADRSAGFAVAFVTPGLLETPEQVKSWFLECLGMYLVGGRRRATLHAAGLQYGERGVLLTGPDGAGKSTLAYACIRAGFRLLAEDIVFGQQKEKQKEGQQESGQRNEEPHNVAQRDEGLQFWGDSRFLHLLPDAPTLFPDLLHTPQIEQINGETKLRVRVDALRPDAGITQMPVWGVCSLERGTGAATRLLPADPAFIRRSLTYFKGDPPVDQTAMQAAVDRLLTGPTAHLKVGSDLEGAVNVLRRWIEET